jgi:hypothetical protein
MTKAALKKRRLFHQKIGLYLKEEIGKFYIWSVALYGAETWAIVRVDEKCLKSYKLWCCRRM